MCLESLSGDIGREEFGEELGLGDVDGAVGVVREVET